MIRKVSILLTILILAAAFAFAQETVQVICNCQEGASECKCPEGSCCKAAEQAAASKTSSASTAAARLSGAESETKSSASTAASRLSSAESGTESSASTAASRLSSAESGTESSASTAAARLSGAESASSASTAAARLAQNEEAEEYISSHIPDSVHYNEFYMKSIELSKQAQEAYDNGFYDGSIALAEEAVYYAQLSDKYVSEQLIAEAERLIGWADENNIEKRYPGDYTEGKAYYELSLESQENEEWNEASIAAIRAIEIFGQLEANRTPPLPSQYIVRTWRNHKDCFWNIAGYSFVYGDPSKWRVLYNANRSRLQNPNNPNIIEPGTVLDIPSIQGEHRQGMWDPNANYDK